MPKIEDIATPEINPDEVLIRVEAAALDPLDGKLRAGNMERFFPLSFSYMIGTNFRYTKQIVAMIVVEADIATTCSVVMCKCQSLI